MNVIIAHASIGEDNKVKNGKAGDQTGKEVCTRNWYRYGNGWSCLIRFRDKSIAEKVAKCMEMACHNNLIGYDQNQRNTLLNQSRKFNYDVSKVDCACETDCSALVSVACMYAGVPESLLTINGNCATTRTIQNLLKSTGKVDIFTSPIYTTSSERLQRGDILLKTGHHIVVVITVDNNPYHLFSNLLKEGNIGESVKWLQFELNKNGANISVDGIFGKLTKLAVLLYQKDHGLKQDGIVGYNTFKSLGVY